MAAELEETIDEPDDAMPPRWLPPVPLTVPPLLDGVSSSIEAASCGLLSSGRCGRAGDCTLPTELDDIAMVWPAAFSARWAGRRGGDAMSQ